MEGGAVDSGYNLNVQSGPAFIGKVIVQLGVFSHKIADKTGER